jgi:hypothetical protein
MENTKKKKNKFFKSKLFLFAILPLFVMGLVFAGGYVVNNFSVKVGVAEPFVVSYAILGDAGNSNWQSITSCDDENLEYLDLSQGSQPVNFGSIFAGESRTFCTKIDNKAEVPIDYVVSSSIQEELENYENCTIAFPNAESSGIANTGVTYDSAQINVPGDAPIVNDCIVEISVSRG